MTENSHSTFADLKSWFMAQGQPYTTVYRGTEVKAGHHSHKGNKGDMSSSWEDLEKYLKGICRNGCQVFILCRKKDDNTSVGVSTIFDYSPYRQDFGAQIGSMTPATPQQQGLTPADVAKMMAEERAKWERDREIEELKATIGAIQEERQKPYEIANQILGHPSLKPFIAIGSMMLASKMGLDPSLIAQIAGNTEGGHNSDDEHPIEHEDDEIFNEAIENFEGAGFSATEVKKLSIWAKQNKDFAKQIFNSKLSNQMQ